MLVCYFFYYSWSGDVGDVTVGRITGVGEKRWKVDTRAKQDAVLMLSSIDLPGDVRRRRTQADQLRMRDFYEENDLISV
jgi:exosome complex component RRP4